MFSENLLKFSFVSFFLLGLLRGTVVHGTPLEAEVGVDVSARASSRANCFPALGFKMPNSVPSSTDGWWCDTDTEYGFVGFSYEVTACQSQSQLVTDFKNIRKKFNGRYIRLYGFCDNDGFYDDIIEAAWAAGLGVQALIWFGFDGGDEWMTRRDTLFATLHSNPKAPFTTRVVQFGSEPLFDSVLPPEELAAQVVDAKAQLSDLGILVTVSDLAFSYQENEDDGASDVLAALDFVDAHMLPFFSQQASIANDSWPLVLDDLDWFVENVNGKKIYLSENGWPSVTSSGVQPNSPDAVANVQNEHDYYTLLDSKCTYFKNVAGGGVGWFAHIYSDDMEPGYGIYGDDGELKFPFAPKTSC
ncbi:glycoside hydrolase superfamily [Rhodocollybia butyracea]|uniref:glucan endo-1,3-beta-D-glucosidase n=1 Tax=Rhodocollybia butyracea TaxID=206335 RepID=A0A9P5UA37_9AGAR|nr:glycoside hydrolase superfamily [Rhodocollybia butyracea]